MQVAGSVIACALVIPVAAAFVGPEGDAAPGAPPTDTGGEEAAATRGESDRTAQRRRATREALERALARALAGEQGGSLAAGAHASSDPFYHGDGDMQVSSCELGAAEYIAESFSATSGAPSPDGWNLFTNGSLLGMHEFGSERSVLTVRARGKLGGGAWPRLVITIGGEKVGEFLVDRDGFADYELALVGTGVHEIGVWFANDYFDKPSGDDRNLYVDSITVTPLCP